MRFVSRTRTTVAGVSRGARAALLRVGIALPVPGERGQGMLEYAIIGGIIIIGAVAALAALSGALNRMFAQITDTLSQY